MKEIRAHVLTKIKDEKARMLLTSAFFLAATSQPALANSFFGHVVELVPSATRPLPGIPVNPIEGHPSLLQQLAGNVTVDLGRQNFLYGFRSAIYGMPHGADSWQGDTPADGKVFDIVVEADVINGSGEVLLDFEYKSIKGNNAENPSNQLDRTSCEFRLSESRFTEAGPLQHIATLPKRELASGDHYDSLFDDFRVNIAHSGTYVFQMFCTPGDGYYIYKMRAMGTTCKRDDSVTDPLACMKP